ncbi:CoA-binding domain protein [Desulfatibacillum aliphaticivorans]|uniref:CoA-binding domain protein n=2 Tax=Desulfatibacillum aliphaticivorans TaxID=218208 RepID=B8FEI4_DESAL|nr:CoA-binding domain protein [Desulfatibacillum aliphaticivorans]
MKYLVMQTTKQIQTLMETKSVAIVGLPRGMKTGKLFLIAIQDMGFKGPIYPVNPFTDEIDGLKSYPSVEALPEPVDMAIILVPNSQAKEAVVQCAEKGVKGAVLFTAGYKETGEEEGAALEEEMASIAKKAGMRLIGPNGMGLYSPEAGISFFPGLPAKLGPIALLSHSGSMANILCRMGPEKGLYFRFAVSLGNECDLTAGDFLEYCAQDSKTGIVAAYLEGIRKGDVFLKNLKKASENKPVILWKMGLNPEGASAAASHTGSMAGDERIWNAVVSQARAVSVNGFEEWVDAMMGFSLLPRGMGRRAAIISGPGGLAVSAAQACGRAGLTLAALSTESREKLAEFVPQTGTSLKNPVDIGMNSSLDMSLYIRAAQIMAEDPNVDIVMAAPIGLSLETNHALTQALIDVYKTAGKPFVMIKIPGFEAECAQEFCQAGVPFFDSAERAAATCGMVYNWQKQRGLHKQTP